MNPSDQYASTITGISGTKQVGMAFATNIAQPHAIVWNGSANNYVDLNPPGSSLSVANGIDGNQEVGYAINGSTHAGIWSGTAASWVDINPAFASGSNALAAAGGYQVGEASVGGGGFDRAILWHGSATDYVDLSAYLPVGVYTHCSANGIEIVGNDIWVVGSATNLTFTSHHAMLWHYSPVPEPATMAVLGLGILGVVRRRRHLSS